MNNLKLIKARISEKTPEYIQLCSDFLILYSRFEYALKVCGFLFSNNQQVAMASIKDFSESLEETFKIEPDSDLQRSVKFILDTPPKVLLNVEDHLSWEDKFEEGNTLHVLPEYLRRVRNNLLHGGKFYGGIEPGSRNWNLISSSMIIIEHWIDLNENVKRKFGEF